MKKRPGYFAVDVSSALVLRHLHRAAVAVRVEAPRRRADVVVAVVRRRDRLDEHVEVLSRCGRSRSRCAPRARRAPSSSASPPAGSLPCGVPVIQRERRAATSTCDERVGLRRRAVDARRARTPGRCGPRRGSRCCRASRRRRRRTARRGRSCPTGTSSTADALAGRGRVRVDRVRRSPACRRSAAPSSSRDGVAPREAVAGRAAAERRPEERVVARDVRVELDAADRAVRRIVSARSAPPGSATRRRRVSAWSLERYGQNVTASESEHAAPGSSASATAGAVDRVLRDRRVVGRRARASTTFGQTAGPGRRQRHGARAQAPPVVLRGDGRRRVGRRSRRASC